jgi:hypothetical protein
MEWGRRGEQAFIPGLKGENKNEVIYFSL